MSLIDSIQNVNEKYNIKHSSNGYSSKVLTLDDISDTVELYKIVYEILQQKNCGKFIHPMDKEALEEIMSSKDQAILGYFKDKKLMGTLYTKPFEKDNPYFQTPNFDEGTTYALGGLAVNPKFRGQGVITKLSKIFYKGVKDFAVSNPDEKISGIGAEISCENFDSIASVRNLKNDANETMLHFNGIHFVEASKGEDIDLTILGYGSFSKEPEKIDDLPIVHLDKNQGHAFDSLNEAIKTMSESGENGFDTKKIGEHSIVSLNDYIEAPYNSVFDFDKEQN